MQIDLKGIIEVMQNQLLLNQPQSDKEYMELINKVTKEDVVKMANQAYLDTIYVLTKEVNHSARTIL